jgi:hypothetical protein
MPDCRPHPILRTLVPCLAAAGLAAADGAPAPRAGGDPGQLPPTGFTPGRMGMGQGRQIVVQGLFDADYTRQGNYLDADSDQGDHRDGGQIRAELGLRVKLDERVTAVIGFGYRGDIGDYGPTNQSPGPSLTPEEPQRNSDNSQAVIKDAYAKLKEFLGYEELGVAVGRMPVAWDLRRDRGALLFDSRANDPVIASWDGAQASYNYDEWVLSPYAYRLPDASSLWGVIVDWRPVGTGGSDKMFVTAAFNEQRDLILYGDEHGERLRTFSAGFDWIVGSFELWGEGAGQRGEADGGQSFRGYGGSLGGEWQFTEYGHGILGLQGDWQSGDDDPTDGTYKAFVNPWESVSDTIIVENERYGELSRLMPGNLRSLKLRWGMGLDERDRVRAEIVLARYQLDRPIAGGSGSREFGDEADLTLRWQYNWYTAIRLFAAGLKPGDGLRDAMSSSPGGNQLPGSDVIYMFGGAMAVTF